MVTALSGVPVPEPLSRSAGQEASSACDQNPPLMTKEPPADF